MTSTQATSDTPVLYCWTFGKAEFDEGRWQLSVDGVPVELERKPLEVLQYLLRHAGEAVTKEELLATVWDGRIVVEAVLTNAIGKLRRALQDGGTEAVATLPRIGYRLEVPVKRRTVEFLPLACRLSPGDSVPRRHHWRLEQPLANNGDSEVWLARHAKTEQLRVFKFSLDGRRLAALKREVTIGRLLGQALGQHPGFVHVIDWDFELAPYFVEFEYGGTSLDHWRDGESGIEAMPLETRLALFAEAAETVAAAHGVGVLHKDLKPANLLVHGEPGALHLRVADFGSSRVFEPGLLESLGITRMGLTQTQAISPDSGTPLYLAPEVVAGQAPTVKSDIYALGVTLYQLVVGDLRRPLSAGWEADIADPLLRRDIAAAANGDPDRRQASVAQLAEDVRTLGQRREKAALEAAVRDRIAMAERRASLARVRRPWVMAAMAALVVAVVVSSLMWRRSEQQRHQAEQQARRAEAVVKFMSNDLIGATSPGGVAYEKSPTIRELLEQASAHVDESFRNDVATRGSLHAALGASWRTLGDRQRSEQHLKSAVRDYAAGFGPADDLTLLTRYDLANTLSYEQKYDQAGQVLNETDALAGNRLKETSELAFIAARSRAVWNIQKQDLAPAEQALRRADQLQRELHPEDAVYAAQIRMNLADLALRQGRSEDALLQMQKLLNDPSFGAEHIGEGYVSALQLNMARALRNLGRYTEALPLAKAAAASSERILGPNEYQTLVQFSTVASIYDQAGDCSNALAVQRMVRQRMSDHFGADKQATLVETGNLGGMEYECGDRQAGIDYLQKAEQELRAKHGGEGNVHSQAFRFTLAQMLVEQHRYDDALSMLDGLDPDTLTASDSTPGWKPRLQALRGQILVLKGQIQEGHRLLADAVPALVALGNQDPEELKKFAELLERASVEKR